MNTLAASALPSNPSRPPPIERELRSIQPSVGRHEPRLIQPPAGRREQRPVRPPATGEAAISGRFIPPATDGAARAVTGPTTSHRRSGASSVWSDQQPPVGRRDLDLDLFRLQRWKGSRRGGKEVQADHPLMTSSSRRCPSTSRPSSPRNRIPETHTISSKLPVEYRSHIWGSERKVNSHGYSDKQKGHW